MKKIGIFASGGPKKGGTGARKLLERMESGEIGGIDRVVVVSNHVKGVIGN